MDIGTLSFRYAKALFSLAKDKGLEEQVYENMKMLSDCFLRERSLQEALVNPLVSTAAKEKLLVTAGGIKVCDLYVRFIRLVLGHKRDEEEAPQGNGLHHRVLRACESRPHRWLPATDWELPAGYQLRFAVAQYPKPVTEPITEEIPRVPKSEVYIGIEVKIMAKNMDPSVEGIGAAAWDFISMLFCLDAAKSLDDDYEKFTEPSRRRYGYVMKLPDELAGPGTGLEKYHNGRYIIRDRKRYELFLEELRERMTDDEIEQFENDYIYYGNTVYGTILF